MDEDSAMGLTSYAPEREREREKRERREREEREEREKREGREKERRAKRDVGIKYGKLYDDLAFLEV